MNLKQKSLDWIETASRLVEEVPRPNSYLALEGLPGAGKTTMIGRVDLQGCAVVNELRINPDEESCQAYLRKEKERKEAIYAAIEKGGVILGDRSLISTIAHKAALLSYDGAHEISNEIDVLREQVIEGNIILPSAVFKFNVGIEKSRERQRNRNRNNLVGRLWYDADFLRLIRAATSGIIDSLYSGTELINIDTENNTEDNTEEELRRGIELLVG